MKYLRKEKEEDFMLKARVGRTIGERKKCRGIQWGVTEEIAMVRRIVRTLGLSE